MYPDPLTVRAGEPLTVGRRDPDWPGWLWCTDPRGKSGWVPESFIDNNTISRDYTARELCVSPGDEVEPLLEVAGWLWCKTPSGATGWLPSTHLT
jgi:hypothetical protein